MGNSDHGTTYMRVGGDGTCAEHGELRGRLRVEGDHRADQISMGCMLPERDEPLLELARHGVAAVQPADLGERFLMSEVPL